MSAGISSLFDPEAPIDAPIRYYHSECSQHKKDKALIITRRASGWQYYCHRCGLRGFRSVSGLSPAQTISFINKEDLQTNPYQTNVRLPKDFTRLLPPAGMFWLRKYGITPKEIQHYIIGYSPFLDRVILPVYQEGVLRYWQGRNVGQITKERPKYINIRERGRTGTYFIGDTHDNQQSEAFVLVEDILSAIKLNRTCRAIALLYAYISDDLILSIPADNKIYIWLDSNKFKEALGFLRRCHTLGRARAVIVFTEADPKECSISEIKKQLV